jgi:hypothetical protein
VKRLYLAALSCLFLGGCASYQYAQQVKLVSFDDNIEKGQSVGPIRGEDCTWTILGMQMGGLPTLDKAFINARNQAGSMESAGFKSNEKHENTLRYVNNVSTENDGFNALLFGKQCLVVKGGGYR